jgi:predicted branched-subunit amino acid permease
MFPALFLALLVRQLGSARARTAAAGGALIAFALTPFVPPGVPIIAAVCGVLPALAVRS